MKEFYPRLYIVTDRIAVGDRSLESVVEQAIRGGATIVQLREKEASEEEMIAAGRRLHAVTRKYNVPLVVNDNINVAFTIDAEGVHLGQDDMPIAFARKILGSKKIIGISVHTIAQAKKAQHDGANYIGVGPVFETKSKKDAGKPIGLGGLRKIVSAVSIPVVAIGGITLANAASVMGTGAGGIAVISAVMGSKNPEKAAKELRSVVDRSF